MSARQQRGGDEREPSRDGARAPRGKAGGAVRTETLAKTAATDPGRALEDRVAQNLSAIERQTQRLDEAISSRDFLSARTAAELIRQLRPGVEGALADARRSSPEVAAIEPFATRWAALEPTLPALLARAPAADPHHGLDLLGEGHAAEEEAWLAALGGAAARQDERTEQAREARWRAEAAPLAAALGVAAELRADEEARRRVEAHGDETRGLAERGIIYLHPTRLTPGSREGRQVLIHELMHVAQARRGGHDAAPSAHAEPDGADRPEPEELAAPGAERAAAEREAQRAAEREAVETPRHGIDLARAAADSDAIAASHADRGGARDRAPRASGGNSAGSHKLKAGTHGPVFAANGLPYLVTAEGVWVIRDWVKTDDKLRVIPEDHRKQQCGGFFAPTRARQVLEALSWVQPARIEWASQNILFCFSHRVDLLTFPTEVLRITGLPAGQEAVATRSARRGLDIVVALDDASVTPGSPVAFTGQLRERTLAAMQRTTGLTIQTHALEMLDSEPVMQALRAGNGAVYFQLDEDLCSGLFGSHVYARWLGDATRGEAREREREKLTLSNYYGQPIPGQLVHTGDPIEHGEAVWFEVQVAWPGHTPDPAVYKTVPMVTPGHRDNVALLDCEWTFERLGDDEPVALAPAPRPAPAPRQLLIPKEQDLEELTADTAPAASPRRGGRPARVPSSAAPSETPAPTPAASPTAPAAAPPVAAPPTASTAASKPRTVVTAKSSVAELRRTLTLAPGEAMGRFRVSVRARLDAYFEPAQFSEEIVVRSTPATMEKLRGEAFTDLAIEGEQQRPESFKDLTKGRGSDVHGTRISGELPADFTASAPPGAGPTHDAGARQRASELQRLQALRMYLASQGPQAREAVEATDRELARRAVVERKLAGDRARGWQPFEVRGTYLSREEGIASGPLALYGTAHIKHTTEKVMDGDIGASAVYDVVDHVVVQVRDLSRRFDSADLTFTGEGQTFEAALRAAFVDLAKAYPKGQIAVLAEELDGDALAREDGSPGPAAARGPARPGTGRAIGFELGTDSRWKRARAAIWDPAVAITVNLGAIALMTFVPPSVTVVAPVLAAFNSAPSLDRVATEQARGTLSGKTLAMSVGEIALNVLPMLGRAKAFTPGWFAIETANWGGQALLMTGAALQAAAELQAQDVAALAAMYAELQALEQQAAADPKALASARAEIARRAKEVARRIEEQLWAQVKDNALVAVAGSVVHRASAKTKAQLIEDFQRGALARDAQASGDGAAASAAKGDEGSSGRHADGDVPGSKGPRTTDGDGDATPQASDGRRLPPGDELPRDSSPDDVDARAIDSRSDVAPGRAPGDHGAPTPARRALGIDHQAIDRQMAGPGHAQTDLHSHFMGNVPPERFAAELEASGMDAMRQPDPQGKTAAERVGDVSRWEPLLRKIVEVAKGHAHTVDINGGEARIKQRGAAGDALDLSERALSTINEKKSVLADRRLAPRARENLRQEIDALAKAAVEKSLRASDETDFNSSYEIRDDLVKSFYGTSDRASVMQGASSLTAARGRLQAHFQGRPTVQARLERAVALEAELARGGNDPVRDAELRALRASISEQFAYDRYTVDTLVRLAQDNITYTEQSNSVKKLYERFDEGHLEWAKVVAKREHPELADQLDAVEVKHVAMITTNNLGVRNANLRDARPGSGDMTSDKVFRESLARVTELMKRGDVVGLDVAGIEHFQFNAEGKARFRETYDALAKLATPKRPVVLRPHVGEGGIDTTPGDPFARDANRQITPGGELTHYARARDNIEALLETLEQIAARPENVPFGGKLPPNVIVRFGHATHTTPTQAARMAELGVIVEVNLGSNQATGALAKDKPTGGSPDRTRRRGEFAKSYTEGKSDLPGLDDHSLATLIFNKVDVVLSTDGHEVMDTSLGNEFREAERLLRMIRAGQKTIRIRADQARAMNELGGTAQVETSLDGGATVEVEYARLSAEKRALFDNAYRSFYEAAHRYLTRHTEGSP